MVTAIIILVISLKMCCSKVIRLSGLLIRNKETISFVNFIQKSLAKSDHIKLCLLSISLTDLETREI